MTVKPITPDDYHYGAVEALAKSGIKGCAIGRLDAEDIIRALEAAGYKVVRPEPTDGMITDAWLKKSVTAKIKAAIATALAVQPHNPEGDAR